MSNSSPPTLRSRIKALQKAAGTTCIVTFWFLIALCFFSSILFPIYSALWIGEPSEVTCQDVDSIRIDCTLKYQALLRSSEQKIKNVQRLDIEQHISSSDSGSTTEYYVAVLRTQNDDRPIKTYPNRNNPELEILNHRFSHFFENPEHKLTVPIQYNLWERVLGFLICICFFSIGVIFRLIAQLIKWFFQQLRSLFWYLGYSWRRFLSHINSVNVKMYSTTIQLWHSKKYQRGNRFIMIQLRHAPQLSHTQFLLLGLAIGYVGFVWWLGIRLIVLVSGAVIVGLAIAFWYRQLQPQKTTHSATSANLLQTDVFLGHINALNHQIPDASQPLWQSVQQQAGVIQQIATQIAQQESTFTPDLLETLHTVLDLVDQLVQALQVTQQVQTPRYQKLAQQQLQTSRTRLQQTHDQLQQLRDQIAFENLERRSLTAPSVISTRLQTLIAENERGILGD